MKRKTAQSPRIMSSISQPIRHASAEASHSETASPVAAGIRSERYSGLLNMETPAALAVAPSRCNRFPSSTPNP